MSHSGIAVVIRIVGAACTVPALPTVQLLDRRGHIFRATRRPPVGMHPGPVMLPLGLGRDQSATAELRWVSGPVFDANRSIRTARLTVLIGKGRLSAPLTAMLYGEADKAITFDQTAMRIASSPTVPAATAPADSPDTSVPPAS